MCIKTELNEITKRATEDLIKSLCELQKNLLSNNVVNSKLKKSVSMLNEEQIYTNIKKELEYRGIEIPF